MRIKRVYVTPKDIKDGGEWDGHGKDCISKALSRAIGRSASAGATLYATSPPFYVGKLPKRITTLFDSLHTSRRYVGPRFNFRIQVED